MDSARLPFGARIAFEEIVRACGRNHYTWLLQPQLASILRVSVRTLQRWEKALVRAGLLSVARVSFWARRMRGGVRRVLVPHRFEGGALRAPHGVLAATGDLLVDGRRPVPDGAVRRHEGRTTAVSHKLPVAGQSCRYMGERESVSPQPARPEPPTTKQLDWCRRALAGGVSWVADQARERLRGWGVSVAMLANGDAPRG